MILSKTIQSKLFVSYSSLILCIIILIMIYYYFSTARTLENKTSESLFQLSGYITSQMDMELKEMNSLSEKILFSQPLMNLFFSDLYGTEIANIYRQRNFNEIIYSITGPQFPILQINMIQKNGNYAGIGYNSTFSRTSENDMDKISWFNTVLFMNGEKFITDTHYDDSNSSVKKVISLSRSFSNIWGHKPDCILEIQQDYVKFSNILDNALSTPNSKNPSSKKVFIFNSEGKTIFPSTLVSDENTDLAKEYWKEIQNRKSGPHTFSINNQTNNEKEIISYTYSDFSNWTVSVSESEVLLLQPVSELRNNTILVGLGVLFITLILSYFVSRGLTTPIKKIHKNISTLSLETLPTKTPMQINSGINELEDLNQSFAEMCTRLKSSIEEVVLSRSHELKAHMLALQSQMNPHFLYNTITVVSIMAEEGGNPDVAKACTDLSQMLRYISSNDNSPVTINQELEHTRNFMALMKIRYGDDLHFTMKIPSEMLHLKIPKLIIQPIIENCTKYAVNVEPPWEITINGKIDPERWEIQIQDNGPGFDERWLKSALEEMKSINPYDKMPNLELDGLGLLNISIRLKLMYGTNAVFHLYNHFEGGAVVIIGGPVQYN